MVQLIALPGCRLLQYSVPAALLLPGDSGWLWPAGRLLGEMPEVGGP